MTEIEGVSAVLAHARYLAGCASGDGDFDGEPIPSPDEWGRLLERIEGAIDTINKIVEARG